MTYSNEIVQLHNELVGKLNTLSAPLAAANAEPSVSVQIASSRFMAAVRAAKVFTAGNADSFADAELIKARLCATADILTEAIEEQLADSGC